MNRYLTEFNTIGNVYLNKILIKEQSDSVDLKDILEKLKNNSSALKEKISKLQNLFYSEMFSDEFVKKLQENPQELARTSSKDLQPVTTESYNIEEGIGSRIKSNISGWKRSAFGEKVPKGESNIQAHRVNKRFEIFRDKVGSHLRELERDLETTSGADESVKNEIKQMISKLSSEEFGNITPKQSKLSDIRHKLGRGVEWGAKALTLGGLGALFGAGIASIAGAVGIPALVIQGAAAGAIRKAASDIIEGKKPNAKQVALQAAIVAVAGPVLNVGADYVSDNIDEIKSALGFGDSSGSTIYTGVEDTGLNPEDYFDKLHGSDFDPESVLDKSKLSFDNSLFEKGLKGLGSDAGGPSPAIVNAASEAGLNADQYQQLAKSIGELPEDKLNAFKANFKSDPEKYAKALINYLIKK